MIRRTKRYISHIYPAITPDLPDEIVFGIGAPLANGQRHDGRAPDYDDWTTPTSAGRRGLYGDIFVRHPLFERAFELSSMGIRVDPAALLRQLEMAGQNQRKTLHFHRRLIAGELPQTIEGGIGQSRLCMLYLRKAHIGEIQASLWPATVREEWRGKGIVLL